MSVNPDPRVDSTAVGVSYVMPVLNDATHVRAAVDSLLTQDYRGPFDIAIARGPSIDGTAELLTEIAAEDPRIRILDNPVGSTPAGLNIAIRATAHPIVVRVDAHSVLPPHYTRVAVDAILATGAANVGGIMDAQGTTPFEEAVAVAYGSRVGLGGTPHHVGGRAGPADTVYLGVFQRDALLAAGLFDERIKRGQDWELNRRLRENGGIVWFTPELKVTYRPRPSLSRLARQFLSTGLWRGELARAFAASNSLRYFAPPVMVLGVALGLLLGVIGFVVAGVNGAPNLLLWGWAIPGVYALFVVLAAVAVPKRRSWRVHAWMLLVLPCIHFCWGIGFVLGYASLARSISDLKNDPARRNRDGRGA